ncbi:minor tail protein [Mycobacterium phage MKC-IRE-01]|uniref:Minor tail protein n=1 Tax=Mycobacterium phage StevieRay TaxID=2015811 RepID=A0A222ZL30_9CAUD|nr:hypothetical protein SEA_STEVIERAY_29 [Mycobacterium phage StevieRay]URP21015.1 hypothetical protein SEA_PHEGASUS_29 [Mycobacterium phage Phegasus]WDW19657.1 minor tail protein [Mycobacterium phage LOCV1]
MNLSDALRTAAEVYNPDDTIDLLGLFIIGLPGSLPAIAALWVTIRGQRRGRARARRVDAKTDEIHEHVVNTHTSNMRKDLDDLRELVVDGFRRVERDIGGIREEIRTERKERIAGDRRE